MHEETTDETPPKLDLERRQKKIEHKKRGCHEASLFLNSLTQMTPVNTTLGDDGGDHTNERRKNNAKALNAAGNA